MNTLVAFFDFCFMNPMTPKWVRFLCWAIAWWLAVWYGSVAIALLANGKVLAFILMTICAPLVVVIFAFINRRKD